MTILAELLIVLALILANGVFAGAEIAILAMRKSRLKTLVQEGKRGADVIADLRRHPERFIATVQIGITVVGTTAAAFGGASLARHLQPVLGRVPALAAHAQTLALVVVVALVSYLSLVLGELVPKSLALRAGERYALRVSRFLMVLSWLARPLVWLLTASSNLVLRPFADRTTFTETRLSREELQQLVEEAATTGALDQHTRELASRALSFDQLTVADVMIPRSRITALSRHATHDEIRRCLLEERRSRMPVYGRTLDDVLGYVTAKDLLPLAWEEKLIVLEDVLRPIRLFAENTPAVEVLQFMQRERQPIAMAVDSDGMVSGLVTLEDLIEELVGEIFSEHDDPADRIRHEPDGSLSVRGDVSLRDLAREARVVVNTPGNVAAASTTIAALCVALAGGLPHRGARLAAGDGTVLVVTDTSPRAVRRVRVLPPPRAAEAADAAG